MSYTINNGLPTQLDGHDTAPPPLPPWLKGFLVTSKKREDVAAAGREIANLCNDLYFKLAYDDLGVPASMVKPGETEVPYDFAEPLLIPGCPGSVFVALRPDNNTVNVRMIAEGTPRYLFSRDSSNKRCHSFSFADRRRPLTTTPHTQTSSRRPIRSVPRAGPRRRTSRGSSPSSASRPRLTSTASPPRSSTRTSRGSNPGTT